MHRCLHLNDTVLFLLYLAVLDVVFSVLSVRFIFVEILIKISVVVPFIFTLSFSASESAGFIDWLSFRMVRRECDNKQV